jgi:hypothetical protein
MFKTPRLKKYWNSSVFRYFQREVTGRKATGQLGNHSIGPKIERF